MFDKTLKAIESLSKSSVALTLVAFIKAMINCCITDDNLARLLLEILIIISAL